MSTSTSSGHPLLHNDRASNCQQQCWHLAGITATVGGIVLVVIGLVFTETSTHRTPSINLHNQFWVGFALVIIGSASSLVLMLYTCLTLSRGWSFFGILHLSENRSLEGKESWWTGNSEVTMPEDHIYDRHIERMQLQDIDGYSDTGTGKEIERVLIEVVNEARSELSRESSEMKTQL